MAVRAVPLLESRHNPAPPVDSDVKGMSSNVKTALPVRTHPGMRHPRVVPWRRLQLPTKCLIALSRD